MAVYLKENNCFICYRSNSTSILFQGIELLLGELGELSMCTLYTYLYMLAFTYVKLKTSWDADIKHSINVINNSVRLKSIRFPNFAKLQNQSHWNWFAFFFLQNFKWWLPFKWNFFSILGDVGRFAKNHSFPFSQMHLLWLGFCCSTQVCPTRSGKYQLLGDVHHMYIDILARFCCYVSCMST
jgi:hypothetical protein